jgi:hypothetical protein
MKRRLLYILIILLLSLPAVWSLFHPGFFPSDDGEWMVVRLSDFHRSFVSGQIPVRWAARLNYSFGYPVFNFLYPLSLYFGEFFHLLGFSFVWSIKLVFIFSFLFSALVMYLFAREFWGDPGGLISAIFYAYAPYRFLDVYVRGSIGEAVSFIFVPLVFWMIYKLSQRKNWLYVVIGAFGYAGLVMSHNIMAMIFTPILIAYLIFLTFSRRSFTLLLFYSFTLVLGLGLSAFFWLPAFYDKQFTILDKVTVAYFWEHFPTLNQLIVPFWGYGPSIPGPNDLASYQIGIAHILVVLLTVVVIWKLQALFFLLTFVIFFFLMLSFSTPVWGVVPMLWRVQFPWRLLAVTAFASSFLAGGLNQLIKLKYRGIFTFLLLLLVIFLNYNYAKPEYFINRPEEFYTTNEATTTVKDEYMPIWVQDKPTERAGEKVEIISGEGLINELFFNSKKVSFAVEAESQLEVQINTIYFPGWRAKIDGKETPLHYQNEAGVIRFKVEAGRHRVAVEFGETPVRLLADIISLGSFLVAGELLIKLRKSK